METDKNNMNVLNEVKFITRDMSSGLYRGLLDFIIAPIAFPSLIMKFKNKNTEFQRAVYNETYDVGNYLGIAFSIPISAALGFGTIAYAGYEASQGNYLFLSALAVTNLASSTYEIYKSL